MHAGTSSGCHIIHPVECPCQGEFFAAAEDYPPVRYRGLRRPGNLPGPHHPVPRCRRCGDGAAKKKCGFCCTSTATVPQPFHPLFVSFPQPLSHIIILFSAAMRPSLRCFGILCYDLSVRILWNYSAKSPGRSARCAHHPPAAAPPGCACGSARKLRRSPAYVSVALGLRRPGYVRPILAYRHPHSSPGPLSAAGNYRPAVGLHAGSAAPSASPAVRACRSISASSQSPPGPSSSGSRHTSSAARNCVMSSRKRNRRPSW